MRRRLLKRWVLTGLGLSLASCSDRATRNLPVPSHLAAELTTDYPAVVRVLSGENCTGTFISPSVVLTAHHCVLTSHPIQVRTPVGNVGVTQVLPFGSGSEGDPNDLALLILPPQSALVVEPIALGKSVAEGQLIRLVGYGCGDAKAPSLKRTGTNLIYRKAEFLEVLSAPVASFIRGARNRVGGCQGDSGGPVLTEGSGERLVVGIIHGGARRGNEDFTEAVDLTRDEIQRFLGEMNRLHGLSLGGL